MTLKNTDLFVIQSQEDNELYKLELKDLIAEIEAGTAVNFRGSVDLNLTPAANGVTLPANNGDVYVVVSDADPIEAGWDMQGGETTAGEGDRLLYDGNNANWILITSGNPTEGTVRSVTATKPLNSDGDAVNPVLTIDEATTTIKGYVERLATENDVKHTDGTGDNKAVVTADLLKETNEDIDSINDSLVTITDIINNLVIDPPVISQDSAPAFKEDYIWFNSSDGKAYVGYKDEDDDEYWVNISKEGNNQQSFDYIALKAPNGTEYRLSVANDGTIQATATI